MIRHGSILFLWLIATIAVAAPAAAFWERSQWSRCSEASTADEWTRNRCRELDPGYDGLVLPGVGGLLENRHGIAPSTGRTRRGSIVKRLG